MGPICKTSLPQAPRPLHGSITRLNSTRRRRRPTNLPPPSRPRPTAQSAGVGNYNYTFYRYCASAYFLRHTRKHIASIAVAFTHSHACKTHIFSSFQAQPPQGPTNRMNPSLMPSSLFIQQRISASASVCNAPPTHPFVGGVMCVALSPMHVARSETHSPTSGPRSPSGCQVRCGCANHARTRMG